MRALGLVCVVATALTVSVSAHHSYGAYDRDRVVTLEGTIRAFAWKNPHPLLEIATADATVYTVEWWTTSQLAYHGVTPDDLKAGDRVVIVGYGMRDASQRRMSMVRMVRRVSDGRQWGAPPSSDQ